MGEAVDQANYGKKSLQVVERNVTQGPVVIHYAVSEGKAQGELKMNGQARPIAVDLGGDTFGDGPSVANVLAVLPLADGYSAAFRSLNMQSQQVVTVQLRVIGSEQVTVAAGSFDAFKAEVEVPNVTKTTLWIAKSPRRMVKSSATGPMLGGATIVSELQP
jgi:hypothetical protein